ncbi:VOC family protein [Saccharomonospora sp. NPDC046836]|uniref:VOC family protein n=1 Tax=Saccharomonospora sp. NPDC046836 TaxID=3156921 RepID=UPI0033E8C79D
MNNPGVWPSLLYRDAETARRFLTEVFGFTEALVVRGEDDVTIAHAELIWPEGGGVMFGSRDKEGSVLPLPAEGPQWLYVATDDPDAVYKRAVDAGAMIHHELRETDYGSRDVAVGDPEGNIWTFGTYRGAHAS